jgi:hypothetical protein
VTNLTDCVTHRKQRRALEIGYLEESLNIQRFFIRFIPSCMRFFSLLTGRLPTAHNTKMEVPPFMSAFERTIRVNFTLFTSNNVVPKTNRRIHRSEFKEGQPKLRAGQPGLSLANLW